MMDSTLHGFIDTLQQCWTRETSGDPQYWSDKNPSYKQCLVTALLANEMLGLAVYAEKLTLDSGVVGYHYFNKDTRSLDTPSIRLCEEQFVHEHIISKEKERQLNEDAIAVLFTCYPDLTQKYELLKKNYYDHHNVV